MAMLSDGSYIIFIDQYEIPLQIFHQKLIFLLDTHITTTGKGGER